MELFRRIIILKRPLTRGEQGPLRYSGHTLRHVSSRVPGAKVIELGVYLWFWVPPHQRERCSNKSRVPDASANELRALADGVIEEEYRVLHVGARLPGDDFKAWLYEIWNARCVERLGFVPEIYRKADAVTLRDDRAGSDEQERSRIILATS